MREWLFGVSVPDQAKNVLLRFNNTYMQCASKFNDTVLKIDKSIRHLSESIDLLENEEKYAYDGAPMSQAAVIPNAYSEISYHLDSLFFI